jgi:hypothetical protein
LENLWPDSRCLTLALDHRLNPNFALSSGNNVKLLIGLSGAGKTRSILELLFAEFGFYFVASTKSGIGSADLEKCIMLSKKSPSEVKKVIGLLVFIRVKVLQWFFESSRNPSHWLYAQLYPMEVFGTDLFEYLLDTLWSYECQIIKAKGYLVVVDEAQDLLDNSTCHIWPELSQTRPFLSPLIRFMKPLTEKFVLSGTGINYLLIEQIKSSNTLKDWPFSYENMNQLPYLDQKSVYEYSKFVLKKRLSILGREHTPEFDRIASKISTNVLCHGRPRLAAFVLDRFIQKLSEEGSHPDKCLSFAFDALERYLRGADIDKIVRFVGECNNPGDMLLSGKNFSQLILEMFISSLVQGKGSATFSKEEANDAAELISRGVGFLRIVDTLGAREIVLREPAVRFYLSTYYPFHKYIDVLLLKIHEAPRNTHIGDWFEYLVAAALMKNLMSPDQRPGMCSNYNIVEYLNKGSENTFLKPDDMCGPDLLYKRGKDLYIVQVRCVKYFYRAYRLNSEKTVDPNLFYTVRNPKSERLGKVLKGYEAKRKELDEVLQRHQFNIHRWAVASTRVKVVESPAAKDVSGSSTVKWISRYSPLGKDFFKCVRQDDPDYVWRILDEQCNKAPKFEEPNAHDPDDVSDP